MSAQRDRIVLCADDYGLGEGVSRGILRLARMARISAASAMVNGTAWPRLASEIMAHRPTVAVGLHLTLTWGRPIGPMPDLAPSGAFPSLARLLSRTLARRTVPEEIEGEIARQLDRFEAAAGGLPDFVDGHQHVHVLPGIREALLRVLEQRGLSGKIWLRNPADRAAAIMGRRVSWEKALFVSALAAGFGDAARRAGFTTNAGFSGFSPFHPDREPAEDFEQYLDRLGTAHLVMCHPGEDLGESDVMDDIAACRVREAAFLGADAFPALLARLGVALTPSPFL